MSSLEEALAQYPREQFMRGPTPLHRLDYLSDDLGVNFYIKRDDLTEMALGGDKPRKMEYEMARAIAEGADTLVTCGSAQSNHARLTTATARAMGLKAYVVLSNDEYKSFQGNLLTVYLMGAEVRIVDTEDHWGLEKHVEDLLEELKGKGLKPYFVPVSGSTPLSSLGYVRGGLEMIRQLDELNVKPDAVYTPFGTGASFTSILMTMRDRGFECPVIGISVNRKGERLRENLEHWWSSVSELLKQDPARDRGKYEIYDEFVGREYGDPTEACLDALMKMACIEGVLLDPVYSAKTFSGFLAHHKEGRWKKGDNILMVHTGGVPAIFAYHKFIEAHLKKRGVEIYDFDEGEEKDEG